MKGASREQIVAVFVGILGPYIGANMASASVRGHCEKLRLVGALTSAEIASLVDAIAPALSVFVGRKKSETILDELRTALGKLEVVR